MGAVWPRITVAVVGESTTLATGACTVTLAESATLLARRPTMYVDPWKVPACTPPLPSTVATEPLRDVQPTRIGATACPLPLVPVALTAPAVPAASVSELGDTWSAVTALSGAA